jgi:hypothetical protein
MASLAPGGRVRAYAMLRRSWRSTAGRPEDEGWIELIGVADLEFDEVGDVDLIERVAVDGRMQGIEGLGAGRRGQCKEKERQGKEPHGANIA